MGNQPGLSESEREVLKALWDHGPATVRELNAVLSHRGRRWAYTTVAGGRGGCERHGWWCSWPSAR